jgi:uncharacterized glyoxalase superfamily protein PhnB
MTDAAATGVIEDAVAIVPVLDIAATMDFYADTLGFERRMVMPDFAIAVHGEAALHFLATDNAGALTATANHISVYLWVSGIDALWERLRGGLEALPEGRVRAPFDQPYGMREFHVKDPDGCLLMFGEARSDG